MINPFNFFSQKICLTMGGAEEQQARNELQRAQCYAEMFRSIPSIGPHQSFNLSVKAILQKFYDSGQPNLLFLEDDIEFRNLGQLWPALQELPADWDIFYLGCNIRSEAVKVTDRIYRITDAWTTHSVAFTRNMAKFILDNAPGESEEMIDNWIGRNLGVKNAYVCKPFIGYQRARLSRIWNTFVDYEQVFKESQMKMV